MAPCGEKGGYLGPKKWGKVVSIIPVDFWYENFARDCTWKTVVLILKDRGDLWGIGLVEVLCNTAMVILN